MVTINLLDVVRDTISDLFRFGSYIYQMIVIILGIVAAILITRKKTWFKQYSALLLLRIPIVGEITRKIYLARFANTMRLLTETNTPLLQAMDLVRQMITFYPVEQSLKLAQADILLGSSLSQVRFPNIILILLSLSK